MDNPSDFEQLQKRVEWLDNEHRNDKTTIATLQSKLETTTIENAGLQTRLKDLESEVTRLSTLMEKLNQFEEEIDGLRTETSRQIENFKDSVNDIHIHTERHQQQINDANKDVLGLRKRIQGIEAIDINKALEERKEEDNRLARLNEELRAQLNDMSRFDEDYQRSLRMIEENRRQDAKRLTDIQGEIASIRKRADETRGKQDLVSDNMRKLEVRIKELLDAESERREAQTAFLEKVNMHQVNRDRIFSDWEERFEKVEQITADIEGETAGLNETHRSVKQSQAALEDVTQRFERRINEITEVQRLTEDRFRQEWTTFKADDQKRWSNYIISQDEQHREMNLQLDKLNQQATNLDEAIKVLQDTLQQLGREEISRMQTLLTALRDSIDDYQNIFKE